MKITIESTPTITMIDGVQVRQWKGVTDQGVECIVFVHRVAVRDDRDQAQFERELRERPEPDEVLNFRRMLGVPL